MKKLQRGDRVVVPSFICCGNCWFCQHDLYSLCDNTNPRAAMQELALGYPTAGSYGYTHAFGGYAGSHAECIRVPHAGVDCFKVPEGLRDEQVLFLSGAAPIGYMGADFCNIQRGDTVAVWGAGGVGQMAMQSARILGAERAIAIDNMVRNTCRKLLEHVQRGALDAEFLATHQFALDDAPRAYDMFKNKQDGMLRAVFKPS